MKTFFLVAVLENFWDYAQLLSWSFNVLNRLKLVQTSRRYVLFVKDEGTTNSHTALHTLSIDMAALFMPILLLDTRSMSRFATASGFSISISISVWIAGVAIRHDHRSGMQRSRTLSKNPPSKRI